LKLVYLHQYFTFPDGNGGTRSYDLATQFIKRGIDVEIITSSAFLSGNFKKGWNLIQKEGLKIHVLKLDYDNGLSNIRRIIVFLTFLYKSALKLLVLKADVILATSTPLTIGIPVLIKKWFHNTQYIFEVRDVWPEAVIAIGAIKNKFIHNALYFLERTIYKNAISIVPLSMDMRHSIETRYPFTIQKIKHVIENISEVNRFSNCKPNSLRKLIGKEPRFPILYAGTFGKVNGLSYVIKLAEKTIEIDDSIVFLLVGSGIDKGEIVNLATKKNLLNKNIFILDPISKNELPSLYSPVKMGSSFVIPIKELWANSANKFFDSLAASRPVLINHEGWQAKVIRENNLGYVLPAVLDDKSIIDFVNYTKDLELNKIQQHNAFAKAKEAYSLEVAVEKYISIFNEVQNV
jgi:glycosyltransferase involved in cell wall biosynthesis